MLIIYAGDHSPSTRPGRRAAQVLARASSDVSSTPRSSESASERMYVARGSDVFFERYQVRGSIGFGANGTVVRAQDNITGTAVAIKVLHRDDRLPIDLHVEERMYEKLLAGCNPHISLFAQVLGSGDHEGFHCIIFELCQCTLYDVLQDYSGLMPLPTRHIVEIAYQLVRAIEYLHSLKIVHTDIKLDNIALRAQDTVKISWLDPVTGFHEKKVLAKAQICVLDLGNAVEFQGRGVAHGTVGARGYCAPEVVLGLPWSYAVDSFGVGCVLSELYLGHHLFDPQIASDREYLTAIERLLGPFPDELARTVESRNSGTFTFTSKAVVQYPPPDVVQRVSEYTEAMRRLERVRPLAAQVHDIYLIDLLRNLLAHDPSSRISMEVAAKHRFFDVLMRLQWQ
ncbi:kinase-like protein [Trametes sanguinea]|nr:kinase-like protein [Trametes sanguinea]